MLFDAISALFWTIYNLFETFFITQNVIKLRHGSYYHIKMIKKRNKQQSLVGRIDKLGGPDPARGPEFENHCYRVFISILNMTETILTWNGIVIQINIREDKLLKY